MKKLGGGAYGDRVAEHFHLDRAQSSQIIPIGSDACFAATRLTWGDDGLVRTTPLAKEQALMVILQLEPLVKHKLWLEEKPQPVDSWAKGAISMVDLELIPTASMDSASDVLQFYFPRSSLAVAADQNEHSVIRDLVIRDGTDDPTIHRLGCLMLPVLQTPTLANRLFLTGLMTSLYEYLRQTYSSDGPGQCAQHYCLNDALLARAKEMISSDLAGTRSLADIASECRLPTYYFAQAFRLSTGMEPHHWQLLQRVERAKNLLISCNLSEENIALECGFANRSHLARAFAGIVGVSLSEWSLTVARQDRHKTSD